MFPALVLGAFGAWFVAWGIAPSFREDWLLENLLVLAAVPALVWAYPRLRFSNGVYLGLFVFFCLHEVGAHYTYSLVPYREWIPALAVTDRNHYDRLVHFCYGLLVTAALGTTLSLCTIALRAKRAGSAARGAHARRA